MNPGLKLLLAPLVCATSLAQAADGLSVPTDAWQHWQTRISLSTLDTSTRVMAASLVSDYYFRGLRIGRAGASSGFRATSGVMFGAGSAALGAAGVPFRLSDGLSLGHLSQSTVGLPAIDWGDTHAVRPYLGLGYTSLEPAGGWGFTADLGLVAENPAGAWRLGRALLGPQRLDDAVRALRLSPVLQLGVRYSF